MGIKQIDSLIYLWISLGQKASYIIVTGNLPPSPALSIPRSVRFELAVQYSLSGGEPSHAGCEKRVCTKTFCMPSYSKCQ